MGEDKLSKSLRKECYVFFNKERNTLIFCINHICLVEDNFVWID